MKKAITFRGNIDWRQPERRKYLGNGGHARAASAPAKNSSARRVRVVRRARVHAERWDPMIPRACVACKIQNKFVLACSPDVDIGKRYRLAFCRHHGVCNTGAPLLHGVKKKAADANSHSQFQHGARDCGQAPGTCNAADASLLLRRFTLNICRRTNTSAEVPREAVRVNARPTSGA